MTNPVGPGAVPELAEAPEVDAAQTPEEARRARRRARSAQLSKVFGTAAGLAVAGAVGAAAPPAAPILAPAAGLATACVVAEGSEVLSNAGCIPAAEECEARGPALVGRVYDWSDC